LRPDFPGIIGDGRNQGSLGASMMCIVRSKIERKRDTAKRGSVLAHLEKRASKVGVTKVAIFERNLPHGRGRRRILTLMAVLCCLSGCASRSIYFDSLRPLQPNDSARNSITDLPSGIPGGVSLPHRDLIRVDFTAGTDLRSLVARESNILFVHSYFCDRGDNLGTLGGPGVYVDRVDAGRETLVKRFLFFIDVSRKPNPGSIPPEPGFDLSVNAQDICFYVTAHSVATTYKSEVAIIPKASIEQVFIGWKLQ
jgi:hypothetical protein